MLDAGEKKIIKDLLPSMAEIQNAVPGEVFAGKEADTLMVLQRRMEDCELKRQLQQYSEIFGCQRGATITDITNSMIAYIRIRVLIEEDLCDFDGRSYRELIKECRSQIDRTTNIIRLSKANAMTAEEFQRERINETIRKNEAFISTFETEIAAVEKKIERMPASVEEAEESSAEESDLDDSHSIGTDRSLKRRESGKVNHPGPSFMEKIDKFFHAGKEKRLVEEELKNAEKRSSRTLCEEIPYYEKRLVFTECVPCKDLGAYCILKRKDNVYFGLRNHVKKGVYENPDQSLIELTNVSGEFIQLMTEDILSGEYQLQPLSVEEKQSMRMYLDFITNCFEKHIGITLSAAEYLAFKDYYSRLTSEILSIEDESRINYYRAIPLADQYLAYMNAYNMVYSEKRTDVIRKIEHGDSQDYRENLQMIFDHHVTDEKAKDRLMDLITKLTYFLKPEMKEEENTEGIVIMPKDFEEAKIRLQFQNSSGEVVDEATFIGSNLKQAVRDYMTRTIPYKRIGLVLKEKEIYLYGARNGTISVPLLNDRTKKIRGLSDDIAGQLISFYEEQIRREMTDFTEGKYDE